ncbi:MULTISPECIES: hypothetical protein [Archaeoglobus]|uniref:Uncharacterized protein n=2 Tax=Archaeoglobus fulgidus TaxID=2234 RepID=A0A075WAI3_ARCFL|nr:MULTISPECIES: hypothetical protein [Archaeoglobus]AIG96996.1 hypothetical protein AFULGI_00001600 [Archaeoglobus fulgidus DSM 8774]KUJ93420.1 MAG: hypothetical protein XD40_1400 [Archaeoglobus fulgidus]KUK05948.1 MAG: hypothetical protein XD48_1810 [Archaeoglobus fulgidus]MDI3497688.1 hypothetical protein [Archaeoglobus sp.]
MTSERKRKKRIYNPVTGKYYAVRQRTISSGKAGQIKRLWKPSKKREKKSIWDLL